METHKGKSIVCALQQPPHAPSIEHRAESKRDVSCKRRLTFEGEASSPKRESIPFDVDATKVAKISKRIKLEAECESSKVSMEDHIFQTRIEELIPAMAGSEVKGGKKIMKSCWPLLDKEGGSSNKQKEISGKNETNEVSEPQTPLPLKEKKPSRRKGSIAIRTSQSTYRRKNNLQPVEKIVSEAWYYTRSLNKLVLDHIEVLESEDPHGVRVSLKGPRSREANNVLREWRKLLRKCDAKSFTGKLDEGNQPQCLYTRGLSFVHKVGSIQGSKVYYPWKGSVLDSVIGVFLTQRVSDNLSSSAFMLLGASFPQIQDCSGYGRHHRILREKRPNARCSPKKSFFDLGSQCSEALGDGANLEKHARISFDEKGQETPRKGKVMRRGNLIHDWSSLRRKYIRDEERETRGIDVIDYADWDAVSRADVVCISDAISSRGMNIKLAKRIKHFLTRLLVDHGNLDLEWLRNVPPQKAKNFLLSVKGLGLKSGECLRLLTLRQSAFPVDINVARVTVRLGWVPAPPIGDKHLMSLLQAHSAVHDLIHEYLWPRLCKLDQETLYQLHCQMITFGKVFCTNQEPRCDECPMRTECKYYSKIIESTLRVQECFCWSDKKSSWGMDKTRQCSRPRCQSKKWKTSDFVMDIEEYGSMDEYGNEKTLAQELTLERLKKKFAQSDKESSSCTDKTTQCTGPRCHSNKMKSCHIEMDVEDFGSMDQHGNEKTLAQELTLARLKKKIAQSDKESSSCMDKTTQCTRPRCQSNKLKSCGIEMDIEDFGSMDKHGNEKTLAQELTLARFKLRSQRNQCLVKDTKGFYPTNSVEPPQTPEKYQSVLNLRQLASKKGRVPKRSGSRTQHFVYELPDCHHILETFDGRDPDDSTPYLLVIWESGQFESQKSVEALSPGFVKQSTTVPGTIMIPCRTALRGNFPLNGTYFQKNEVFADHKTSETPVDVHCKTLEQLPRKTLYCGTSLSEIVKGLSADEITRLFCEGYFCTRGFDCKTSTPKPLERRLHPSSQEKRKQKQQ